MKYETACDLFDAWYKQCLKDDNSLIFDFPNLWSDENLTRVIAGTLERLEEGEGTDTEKLQKQFENYPADDKIWLLLTELQALHYAPASDIKEHIANLKDFMDIPGERTDQDKRVSQLKGAIEGISGVGSTGQHYRQTAWLGRCYYAFLARQYRQNRENRENRELKELMDAMRAGEPRWEEAEQMLKRESIIPSEHMYSTGKLLNQDYLAHPRLLRHCICPDYYYPISSKRHRRLIIDRWPKYVSPSHSTEDEKIYAIGEALKEEGFKTIGQRRGSDSELVDFYDTDLQALWNPTSAASGKGHDSTIHEDTTDYPDEWHEWITLLKQQGQIILQGPPGTGKTWLAKKIAQKLTVQTEPGDRWRLIQFHPSYNYEDFVRGIQVSTKDGETVYETKDRIFAQMAKRAGEDPDNNYLLIIDEINRANVSAVLGELIYALEYRTEPVNTPYVIDGKSELIVPENLYIIGTMNTADRTIGQIDYAVRRRFAFIALTPDESVVENESIDFALEVFEKVGKLVADNLSEDYQKKDVAIGHSYFLAKNRAELELKLKYQVIPILEEYVRDGVLLKSAQSGIKELTNPPDEALSPATEDASSQQSRNPQQRLIVKHGGREYRDPPASKVVAAFLKGLIDGGYCSGEDLVEACQEHNIRAGGTLFVLPQSKIPPDPRGDWHDIGTTGYSVNTRSDTKTKETTLKRLVETLGLSEEQFEVRIEQQ